MNKILEHDGIKLPETSHPSSSNIVCVKCNYVNRLDSKFCERTGCAYPLTQEAFDEIKAAEKAKLQELVTAEIQKKDRKLPHECWCRCEIRSGLRCVPIRIFDRERV
jgi:hypothetical protein